MRNKFLSIVLMLVLFMGLLHYGGDSKVHAAELPNVVKSARITDTEGNPLTGPIGAWQAFRITADYELPNNQVHAGDTTTIELPQGFDRAAPFNFEIKAGGHTVATGKSIVTAEGKHQIILTYTDYAATHSDIHGSFFFNVQINNATQTQTGNIPVNLISSGETVFAGTVQYNPQPVHGVPLIKAGWMDSNDKTLAHYKINVNQKNEEMKNAVLEDTLVTPGMEYVKGSLRVTEGVWVNTGTDLVLTNQTDVTSQFTNKITYHGNKFTINIGDRPAGKGLQFRYDVRLAYEPMPGEKFTNEAKLNNDGKEYKHSHTYKVNIAGGTGEGYKFKIKIIKENEEGVRLKDAQFDVVRVRSGVTVGKLVTDGNGEAEIGDLLRDKYELRETKEPDGYEKLSKAIEVKPGDFGSDKTAYKTIKNKKKKIPKISVEGIKTWDDKNDQDGKRPTEITINLLKNGVKIDSKKVTKADGWKWKFDNLDKYEGGNEIKYAITEEAISGYTTVVNGYDVKNSYTPSKTSVQVTKVWKDKNDQDGKRPKNVVIKLLADGKETGKKVTLTKTNNWTESFTGLDEYKGGNKIVYTIKEEPVGNGYVSVVTGDAKTGFTVTNTRTPEKTTVEGIKTWDDKNDQDGKRPAEITINLLKNGVKVDSKKVTKADGWQWKFDNLDKYENGKEINYTITEEAISGYSTVINGYDVKNSYTPGKTSVQVTKVWKDKNNKDGKRPEKVKIKLLANGEEVPGKTLILSKLNNWTGTFTRLPQKKNGVKVDYNVKEEPVGNGYKSVLTGNAKAGFVVTNSKKLKPAGPAGGEDNGKNPKTGDNMNIALYASLLVISGVMLLILRRVMKRKKKFLP